MTENRTLTERCNGKFIKGVSGNPGGRPKTLEIMKVKFSEMLPGAIDELDRIIHDPKVKAGDKVQAIRLVAEYTAGKAPMAVNLEVQQTFETPEARKARIKELARQLDDDE